MLFTEQDALKRDRADLEKQKKVIEGWAQIRRILEAQQWEDWPSGDIIIRIKRSALVGCPIPGEIPVEACTVWGAKNRLLADITTPGDPEYS